MNMRTWVYFLASAVPPVAAVLLLFLFATSAFLLAWVCAVVIILCAKARAQTGERVARTPLFWTHLSAAIPFFFGMTALAFWTHPLSLVVVTAILCLIVLGTGSVLWYRGLKTQMLHLAA